MRYTGIDHFGGENGYDVEGRWLPRVTRILEIKSKPGLERFLREVGDYSSAETIKVKSAEEGTRIHEAAEKILARQAVQVPDDIRPAMDALESFRAASGIMVFPEFIERRIWSDTYRYAGTIDALAMIGGRSGILDIKTSQGFYPEFNLQTAAYASALREATVRKSIGCTVPIETRWILRINQHAVCAHCGATKRVKGGRTKVRENGRTNGGCLEAAKNHEWGALRGDVELREISNSMHGDMRAFLGAKILWEWEHGYWLRRIGYL